MVLGVSMKEPTEMQISYDGGKTWQPSGFTVRPETIADLGLFQDSAPAPTTWPEYGYEPFSLFGSRDHYRSEDKGYRAHSAALRVAANMRHRDIGLSGFYDRVVSQTYID